MDNQQANKHFILDSRTVFLLNDTKSVTQNIETSEDLLCLIENKKYAIIQYCIKNVNNKCTRGLVKSQKE